jgi:hypothetical protein
MTDYETFLLNTNLLRDVVEKENGVRHVLFDNHSGRTLIAVWDVDADQRLPCMLSVTTYPAAKAVFNRDYR